MPVCGDEEAALDDDSWAMVSVVCVVVVVVVGRSAPSLGVVFARPLKTLLGPGK